MTDLYCLLLLCQVLWAYNLHASGGSKNDGLAALVELSQTRRAQMAFPQICDVVRDLVRITRNEAEQGNGEGCKLEQAREWVKSLVDILHPDSGGGSQADVDLYRAEEVKEREWAAANSFQAHISPSPCKLSFSQFLECSARIQNGLEERGFGGGWEQLAQPLGKEALMGLANRAEAALDAVQPGSRNELDRELREDRGDDDNNGGPGGDGGGSRNHGRSNDNDGSPGGGLGGRSSSNSNSSQSQQHDSADSGGGGSGGGSNAIQSNGGSITTQKRSSGQPSEHISKKQCRKAGFGTHLRIAGNESPVAGCVGNLNSRGDGGLRCAGSIAGSVSRSDLPVGSLRPNIEESELSESDDGHASIGASNSLWCADEDPDAIPHEALQEELHRRMAAMQEHKKFKRAQKAYAKLQSEGKEAVEPEQPILEQPRIWHDGQWHKRIPVPRLDIRGWGTANLKNEAAVLAAGRPLSTTILDSTDRGDKYIEAGSLYIRRTFGENLAVFSGASELPRGTIVGPYVGPFFAADAQSRHKTGQQLCTHRLMLRPGRASMPLHISGIDGLVHKQSTLVNDQRYDLGYYLRNGVASLVNSRRKYNCKLLVEYSNYEGVGELFVDDEYCPVHVPMKQRVSLLLHCCTPRHLLFTVCAIASVLN